MRKKLVSWNSEAGFGGEVVAYKNIHSGKIISKEEYDKMIEREILELWHLLIEEEQNEFDNYNNFRKSMLDNHDSDFIPLVEIDDE